MHCDITVLLTVERDQKQAVRGDDSGSTLYGLEVIAPQLARPM